MCDIGKFFTRALGIPDRDYVSADQAAAQATAKSQSEQALAAQQAAAAQAKQSADSASEVTRGASESRLRRLLRAGPFGAALPTNYGDAQVATRQLYGASR